MYTLSLSLHPREGTSMKASTGEVFGLNIEKTRGGIARAPHKDMKLCCRRRPRTESMIQTIKKEEIPSKKPTGFLFLFFSTLSSS